MLCAPPGLAMAVVGFAGHHVVASAAPEPWVREQLPDDDLLTPMSPRFLAALGAKLGRRDDGVDVLLAAKGLSGKPALQETKQGEHPRVARANAHREDVHVFEDPTGNAVVIVGRGLAQRSEVAVEVAPHARGRGIAKHAFREARRLVSPEGILFAQTAPANAASLRALLAAGFRPIGSEVLFFAGERPPE